MTPLVVLVGFLGAGKTTALRRLLPELQARGCVPTVILNDYQNARVDAEYFREISAAVTPISGSCVCCGSRQELLEALESYQPVSGGVVLLETNGTTDAGELITLLAADPLLRQFTMPVQVSIIDVKRWQKRFWHNGLEADQVRTASFLWFGHGDEVTPERRAAVEDSLRGKHLWQPETNAEQLAEELADLVRDVACQPGRVPESLARGTPGEEVAEDAPEEHRHEHAQEHDHTQDHPHHHDHGHAHEHAHDHEHDHAHDHAMRHHFAATEVTLPEVVSRAVFEEALRGLPPEILRVKGLVRLAEEPETLQIFQKIEHFDHVQMAPLAGESVLPGPLAVLVGSHLPEGCIERFLRQLADR